MKEGAALPVWPTAAGAWRQFAARPDYALRVGWIPALLLFAVGVLTASYPGGPPVASFWRVGFALLNFAVLVQALVAWQRYAQPDSHPRKGATGLRAGRAEVLSLLHFPLVGVLFVPLLVPTMIEGLTAVADPRHETLDVTLGAAGLALLVFPGGLLLMRAALMLPAIAAAGVRPISLSATANHVWAIGAGNSIRLLIAFYLTVLPVALPLALLPVADLPPLARAAASGILLPLYVMAGGGALAGAYGRITAAAGKAGKAAT